MAKFLNKIYYKNKQKFLLYLMNNPGQELPPDVTVDDLLYDLTTTPQLLVYFYEWKQKKTSNDVIIPIYLSDWYQREYYYDDTSLKFKIRLEIDGNVSYIENVTAGDYNLNLGQLDVGEHSFNIEVIDIAHNIKSQRLFDEIWITDDTNDITISETYTATTSDLVNYNITLNLDENATSEQMQNNVIGMTNYMNYLHEQGYRKLIMPANSVVRINKISKEEDSSCIFIPTNFTLDLNGSTIKLHPYDDRTFGEVGSIYSFMVKMVNCIDSHLINGTLEGDYFERKEMQVNIGTEEAPKYKDGISGANGEHNSCLVICGGKYNTVENVNISKITGYNLMCEKIPGTKNLDGIVICQGWGDYAGLWEDNVTIVDGVAQEYMSVTTEKQRCTSPYIDLTKVLSFNYLCIGKWLSNFPSGRFWDVELNFYDENKNFVEYFKVEQSREFKLPNGVRYLRATINGTAESVGSAFYLSPEYQPKYNKFKGLDFIDNRTCLAPNRHKGLLIDGCKFIRSGQSITPLAIDAEDGGNTIQNLYIQNCEIVEVAEGQTGDHVSVAGSNFVYENNINMSVGIRSQVHDCVVRNNTFRRGANNEMSLGWRTRHTVRCYNNDCNYTQYNISLHEIDVSQLKIKNCKNVKVRNAFGTAMPSVAYEGYKNIQLGFCNRYKNCTLFIDDPVFGEGDGCSCCEFISCDIGCSTEEIKNFSFKSPNYGTNLEDIGTFKDCNFNMKNSTLHFWTRKDGAYTKGKFDNCIFNGIFIFELQYANTMGDIAFNDCTFNGDITLNLTDTKVQFNNCTFNSNINYLNNGAINTEINN